MKPKDIYLSLISYFGNQYWWPIDRKYHKKNNCDSRFEIIIGAILTQNTAWSNVEKALFNLKENKTLDLKNLLETNETDLKKMIKPSGFFNQKAKRLKITANFFKEKYNGSFDKFFNQDTNVIRKQLLDLNGIGPETADSILLYAGCKPVFVVDAYTKRLCKRIPLNTECSYNHIQSFFEHNLEKNFSENDLVEIYQEFHALIVELAKNFCKTKPDCKNCPISDKCEKKL
jgi:endonuclease III related protein